MREWQGRLWLPEDGQGCGRNDGMEANEARVCRGESKGGRLGREEGEIVTWDQDGCGSEFVVRTKGIQGRPALLMPDYMQEVRRSVSQSGDHCWGTIMAGT
ncbi:hypothetical protein E2C01_073052 [Portunus trituberculatus]|uniref:Uncharacterized protein n=1 Tax=Portunus trituberculatus TaxID=210409 RepID=A0A5B7I8D1_PORTR|nr:hypothetical protein [Portunus trituberculatus]